MALFEKIKKLFVGAKAAYQRNGLSFLLSSVVKIIFLYPFYKKFKSSETFSFEGDTFNYFVHYYNLTWENERAVEIPIAWKSVKEARSGNMLEVGNVLSNYFPVGHDILDKYEKAENVINEDVCDFSPGKKYNLIVSISTLEHVGWDENRRESGKILRAVQKLRTLLAPGGKLIATLPVGYNADLDELLNAKKLPFTKIGYLKRVAKGEWAEAGWEAIRNLGYNYPLRTANGIVVGVIEN